MCVLLIQRNAGQTERKDCERVGFVWLKEAYDSQALEKKTLPSNPQMENTKNPSKNVAKTCVTIDVGHPHRPRPKCPVQFWAEVQLIPPGGVVPQELIDRTFHKWWQWRDSAWTNCGICVVVWNDLDKFLSEYIKGCGPKWCLKQHGFVSSGYHPPRQAWVTQSLQGTRIWE